MKLVIHNSSLISKNFCYWLLPIIRAKVLASIDRARLQTIESWIRFHYPLTTQSISAFQLLQYGLNNLIVYNIDNDYVITINPNLWAPGLDRIRISSIMKLIEFGNMQISGLSILSNTLDNIAENIEFYVDMYMDLDL